MRIWLEETAVLTFQRRRVHGGKIVDVRIVPVLLVFGASLVWANSAAPCTVLRGAIPTAIELIQRADVIVVAVPREVIPKSLPPGEFGPFPSRDPNSVDRLRFEVTETLKGKVVAPLLIQGHFA